jgi:hypothetical protein
MILKALSFKNNKGDTITIEVSVYSENKEDPLFLINDILIKKSRKKSEISIANPLCDSYELRRLPFNNERCEFIYNEYLKYVTKEQMQQALINAWEMCKPKSEDIKDIIKWNIR